MNQQVPEIEEVDLVLEYEKLEQEKLRLLQLSQSILNEQTVEIIDDTEKLYPQYEVEYTLGHATFKIFVRGYSDSTFKVWFLNTSNFYIFRSNTLIHCDSKKTEMSYSSAIYKQVLDLYIEATLDVIKRVFAICLPESDYSFNAVDGSLRLTIRLRDVYIKNDFSKNQHKIVDIMYILTLNDNNAYLNGARPTLTWLEASCNYTHSHFSNSNTGSQYVCLGSGVMNGIISKLSYFFRNINVEHNEKLISNYIATIDGMARYEDINGGPYFRIENIKRSNGITDISHSYIESIRDRFYSNLDNILNYVSKTKSFKVKQVQLNNKTVSLIQFDINKAKSLLQHLGIPEVTLDSNNNVISNLNTNSNILDNRKTLHVPVLWKDEVIKYATILGSDNANQEIKSYPDWILVLVTRLVNSFLYSHIKCKK